MARKKPRPSPRELNLPSGGADSHTHLDMGELKSSLDQVLARAADCGVSTLGNVFMGPEAYLHGRGMFKNHDQVFFIMGIHPHEAKTFTPGIAAQMIECVKKDEKIKAVGEIGLDFFYKHSSPEKQRHSFQEQLDLAKQLDMPVVIHSRDAYQQTVDILLEMGFRDRPLLWHCFSQGPDQAREIMSYGWKISVPGSVTFKKNIILRQAVEVIHPGHLLLETDCPFLAPEPYRGKENEPALLGFTALKVAEIKDMDLGELWLTCGRNCRDFFLQES
ncbi:MAG: TatD family hydrolase [Desulfonatronovibrio sp.]